jgi:hypothetical protein
MKKSIPYLVFIFIGFIFIWACEKPRIYSDVPEIKLKSVVLSDSLDTLGNKYKKILITLSIVDGDGDIGIFNGKNNIYPGFEDLGNRDLFTISYKKVKGAFVEDTIKSNFAIPYLEAQGQDKTLKADIEISMPPIYTVLNLKDTVKYDCYLYDRAKHMSNTVQTPQIPLTGSGVIQ